MNEKAKPRLHRLRAWVLESWTREIRHPGRTRDGVLMDDPNHPIR